MLRWLKAPSRDGNTNLIVKLVHRAVIYLVWKERNNRIHSVDQKPPGTIIAKIQKTIILRLDPIARRQTRFAGNLSVLATWLSFFAV